MTGKTDLLYAVPSFISGMASVMDLGATLSIYNESANGEMADAFAIASDWAVTGEDIRKACALWASKHGKKAA